MRKYWENIERKNVQIMRKLLTLIHSYISISNRAKGKLPVSILVGLVEVITDYLTTLFRDQISVIAKYKLSSDRAKEKLTVSIISRV